MRLKLEDLSFSYDSWREGREDRLFNHLELDVEDGEKVLILGEAGSGKSTLSTIISLSCPKYFPGKLEGRVLFDGKEHDSSSGLVSFFSLVPQSPASWFVASCVEDEIAIPLESLGLFRGEISAKVARQLALWDLERYRTVPVSTLSGGEKKRLALATAFVTDPGLIALDESFDDLDARWKSILCERLKETDSSLVVTSARFIPSFSGLFDSIYMLRDGKLERTDEEEARKASFFSFHIERKKTDGSMLEVRNLAFRRQNFSLSVPSFRLSRGEIVALCGANGSGKSTFSRLLCSLEEKSGGDILIDSVSCDSRTLVRSVGYVFQNPDSQIFLPTVSDELSFSMDYLRLDRKEKRRRLEELASLFSLDLEENALLMGYGSRKRLQCAIYYSLDRPYYILDEIESALPYSESARMVELLSSRGAGLLLISHDEDFVSSIADRIYTIEKGVMREVSVRH